MARDQDLDNQADNDEELLDFDLDDLFLSGESEAAGDEIIELADLVENGSLKGVKKKTGPEQ
jgi:hypothetical protein